MKKIRLTVFLALGLFGCEPEGTQHTDIEYDNLPYRVIVVDGCEYIRFSGGNSLSVTHKGNCKNAANHLARCSEKP